VGSVGLSGREGVGEVTLRYVVLWLCGNVMALDRYVDEFSLSAIDQKKSHYMYSVDWISAESDFVWYRREERWLGNAHEI
jgi:hypothetical protein